MKAYIISTTTSSRLEETKAFWDAQPAFDVKVHYNDGRFPSYGRNEILEEFYDSGDEWCVFMDDDITLFPERCRTQEFLDDPDAVLKHLPDSAIAFSPINGIAKPVNLAQQDPAFQYSWVFHRHWDVSKISFVRNQGKRYFQNTDLRYWEDVEMIFRMIKDGYWTAQFYNLVSREKGASTLFAGSEDRRRDLDAATQDIMRMHPEIYLDSKGHTQRRHLWRNNHTPRTVQINYDINQNDLFDWG